MLLWYEYQIDTKCNLIFVAFFGCIFESERRTRKKWKRGGKRRRNANWLSPAMWCLWSWSLSFSLWMESILKSDLNETTTNQKLNVCFHNDQPIFTRERASAFSVCVLRCCSAPNMNLCIYIVLCRQTWNTLTLTLSHRRFQCNLLF